MTVMAKKRVRMITEPKENAKPMFSLAKSDLSIARLGKVSDDTKYETLCTLCQQAIEKSLKSLLIYHNVPYPQDHSIGLIVDEIEKNQISLPADIKSAAIVHVTVEGFSYPIRYPRVYGTVTSLSAYAKDKRYSISKNPLDEQDYQKVLTRCEKIVDWVSQEIQK